MIDELIALLAVAGTIGAKKAEAPAKPFTGVPPQQNPKLPFRNAGVIPSKDSLSPFVGPLDTVLTPVLSSSSKRKIPTTPTDVTANDYLANLKKFALGPPLPVPNITKVPVLSTLVNKGLDPIVTPFDPSLEQVKAVAKAAADLGIDPTTAALNYTAASKSGVPFEMRTVTVKLPDGTYDTVDASTGVSVFTNKKVIDPANIQAAIPYGYSGSTAPPPEPVPHSTGPGRYVAPPPPSVVFVSNPAAITVLGPLYGTGQSPPSTPPSTPPPVPKPPVPIPLVARLS